MYVSSYLSRQSFEIFRSTQKKTYYFDVLKLLRPSSKAIFLIIPAERSNIVFFSCSQQEKPDAVIKSLKVYIFHCDIYVASLKFYN